MLHAGRKFLEERIPGRNHVFSGAIFFSGAMFSMIITLLFGFNCFLTF